MKHLVILALCGGLGTLLRYFIIAGLGAREGHWAILTVNVIGSCLMGVAYVLILEKWSLSPEMRTYVMTGFLGGLTTFSAFSLDVFELLERGSIVEALAYVAASVLCCIVMLGVGIVGTRLFV